MNVVNLRQAPPLNDIVAQLRQLADRLESGEESTFQSVVVFGIRPETFKPTCFCFGCVPPRHELAGLLLHGANMVLTDKEET